MARPPDRPALPVPGGEPGALQLEFVGPDGVVSRHALAARAFHIGRGAANDVILVDDAASARHLRVWVDAAGAWVEDLGSRNGTWRNGQRLEGVVRFLLTDELTLGTGVRLRLSPREPGEGGVPLIEDLELGLCHAFRSDRFTIADGRAADIRVPGAGDGCTLLVEPDGGVWLGREETLTLLALNEPFAVAGRHFQLTCRRSRKSPGHCSRKVYHRFGFDELDAFDVAAGMQMANIR